MKKRIAPTKSFRGQSSQKFKPSWLIHFDSEQKSNQYCRICASPHNLISVCDCGFKYHEKCLLKFIKSQIKQSFTKQISFYSSQIKCLSTNCQKQINFTYQQKSRYGCDYFCQKVNQNSCNKYIIFILMLLIILGTFLYISVYLFDFIKQQSNFILFIIFCFLSLIVAISIFSVFSICCWKYFLTRQIFLKNILIPKSRSTEGQSSSSSDQNKVQVYQNLSENFEIYVED